MVLPAAIKKKEFKTYQLKQNWKNGINNIGSPYSCDFAPCNFYFFKPLKEALGGDRFEDDFGHFIHIILG